MASVFSEYTKEHITRLMNSCSKEKGSFIPLVEVYF